MSKVSLSEQLIFYLNCSYFVGQDNNLGLLHDCKNDSIDSNLVEYHTDSIIGVSCVINHQQTAGHLV